MPDGQDHTPAIRCSRVRRHRFARRSSRARRPEFRAPSQAGKTKQQFAHGALTNLIVVRVAQIREIGNPSLRIIRKRLGTQCVRDNDKLIDCLTMLAGSTAAAVSRARRERPYGPQLLWMT